MTKVVCVDKNISTYYDIITSLYKSLQVRINIILKQSFNDENGISVVLQKMVYLVLVLFVSVAILRYGT